MPVYVLMASWGNVSIKGKDVGVFHKLSGFSSFPATQPGLARLGRLDLLIKPITSPASGSPRFSSLDSRRNRRADPQVELRVVPCARQRRRRRDGRGGQGLRRAHWRGTKKRSCRSDPFLLHPDRHFATSRPDEASRRVSTRFVYLIILLTMGEQSVVRDFS